MALYADTSLGWAVNVGVNVLPEIADSNGHKDLKMRMFALAYWCHIIKDKGEGKNILNILNILKASAG